MPTYTAPPYHVDVVQNAIVVDTNVWVSAFSENSSDHDYAQYFLETTRKLILVPIAVVVETWGQLFSKNKDVDKDKRRERSIAFLAWIADPGHNVRLIPEINASPDYILDLAVGYGVDCADAMIAYLTNHVNESCGLNEFIAIASVDQRDFPPLRGAQKFKYKIYDIIEEAEY